MALLPFCPIREMKALRFIGGTLSVADVPVPDIGEEALVRVLRSGICNTDIEITRGYAGFEGTIGDLLKLVDDLADSRWTMTVAGRELRSA